MKVDAYGNIKATNPPKKRGGILGASGIFSGILAAAESTGTAQPQSAADVQAAASVANLLALQEISENDVRRQKLIQQGADMLDSLENLRRDLLTGNLNMSSLRDIGRQLSISKQSVDDPKLMEIIDEIELRAAVELAKLEMSITNK